MIDFKEIRNRDKHSNHMTLYYDLDTYLEFCKGEISDPYKRLRFLRTLTSNGCIERAAEITFRLPAGSCRGLRTIFRSRKLMLSYLIRQYFYQASKETDIEVRRMVTFKRTVLQANKIEAYKSQREFELVNAVRLARQETRHAYSAYCRKLVVERQAESQLANECHMPQRSCRGLFLLFGTVGRIRTQLSDPVIRDLFSQSDTRLGLTIFPNARVNLLNIYVNDLIIPSRDAISISHFNLPQA